jgi:S1-C subfamily serine protease
VVVTDVKAGGPSYGELVDPDHGGPDIITEVEGTAIRSPADLRKALSEQNPGSIVSLRVYNAQAQTRRVERIKLGE